MVGIEREGDVLTPKPEREGPVDGSGELSIEFELEWDENSKGGEGSSESLEIEQTQED